MEQPKIECCCGRPDCAYLQHNTTALESLEKDVDTAARLGQVRVPNQTTFVFVA